MVGEYITSNTKVLHQCLVHDEYWDTTPSRALHGVGCSKCKYERFLQKRLKTQDSYIREVAEKAPNIMVVGTYINSTTPILHFCTLHGIEWNASPDNILHGHGCVECGNDKIGKSNSKSYQEYVMQLKEANPNIICVGEYKNATTHTLHMCLTDGFKWFAVPSQLLYGRGCPKCSESRGERIIGQWLTKHNIPFERQKIFPDCADIKPLPFDFYIPDINIAIEYDGEQHFRSVDFFGGDQSFQKRLEHDNIKNRYCKNNNITLLRIPYYKNIKDELNNLFT